MTSATTRYLAGILALGLAAACSLLFPFDPGGLPCDASGGCLPGYGCVLNKCVKGADGGVDACGGCAGGERCLSTTHRCVPDNCQFRKCPVGQQCVDDAGSSCQAIPAGNLGALCSSRSQCAASQICWSGAILGAGGVARSGACVLPCSGPDGGCAAGSVCQTFGLGLDAGATYLCLPSGVLSPCLDARDCSDDGLVCTVLDLTLVGPGLVCDSPASGGLAEGLACGLDGGPQCDTGLCVPSSPDPGEATVCVEPCTAGSCPPLQNCASVELQISGDVRFIPGCAATVPSVCRGCDAGSDCGPDAPHCTLFGPGSFCLPVCGSGGGGQCPAPLTCNPILNRCVPADAGAC